MKKYLFYLAIVSLSACSTNSTQTTQANDFMTGEEFAKSDSLKAFDNAVTHLLEEKTSASLDSLITVNSKENLEMARVNIQNSDCSFPTKRTELTGGLKTYFKSYTSQTTAGLAVNLPVIGINGKLSKNQIVQIIYYIEAVNVPCKINNRDTNYVYGIGMSLYLNITKMAKGISVSNLAKVAASAQLDNQKTEVEYAFETYGITGPLASKLLFPALNENFDVDGYAQLAKNVAGLGTLLGDTIAQKYVTFTPQPIANINKLQ